MYLDHFKLTDKPFRENTDPRFLWRGKKHAAALEMLHKGVRESRGLFLLTGDVGTGKTTLISTLMSQLDDSEVAVAKIPNPGVEPNELFLLVSHGFRLRRHVQTKNEFIEVLTRFLDGIFKAHKKALLIIDEAQIMSAGALEEIRSISGMAFYGGNRLNIFLAGQTELDQLLLAPENWAIRDQIALRYKLTYLSERETAEYIQHRLRVAGAKGRIFTDEAIHEIYELANGSPRQINNLCDIALLFGFEKGASVIDKRLVIESKETVFTSGDWGGGVKSKKTIAATTAQDAAVLIDLLEVQDRAARAGKKTAPRAQADATIPKAAPKRQPRPPLALMGIVFLLLLVPAGYLLYSGGGAARTIDKMPFLKSILPAPPEPAAVATTAAAPAAVSPSHAPASIIPADPRPVVVPESSEPVITPATAPFPVEGPAPREPAFATPPEAPPTAVPEPREQSPSPPKATEGATTPEAEDIADAAPPPGVPPAKAQVATQDDTISKGTGGEEKSTAVIDDAEKILPESAPLPEPAPPAEREVVETAAPPESPTVGTGAGKPPSVVERPPTRRLAAPAPAPPPDTAAPLTENPDPSDIIDWLLKENTQGK